MKTNIIRIYAAMAVALAVAFHSVRATGASYVVGISPYASPAQRTEVFQNLLTFMLETSEPSDAITICDALNQKLVTSFVIPEGKLFQANASARARRLAAPLTTLKQFVMTERAYPPALANVIALPQFLDFAATQLRRPGEPIRVLVLASPLYIDPSTDAACSMLSAFPSDATLTAEPQQSVFGCAFKKTILSGVTVHYAFLNAAFLNDYHQERITRFWMLYCQQAGGVLSTFCSDAVVAFRRAKENIQQPCITAQLDQSDTKIEMRQVVRRSVITSRSVTNEVGRLNTTALLPNVTTVVATPTGATASGNREPVSNQNQTGAATAASGGGNSQVVSGRDATAFEPARLAEAFPVKPAAKSLGVGIAWSAAVDLDVWVQPYPGAAELSFHNTNSPQGRYLHDWRSGNLGLDYEYVLMNPDQNVNLSRIGCWVNYYSGKVTPVRGIVVVHYEDRAYQGEFTLNAPNGNKAADHDRRQQSRCWVQIDVAAIVRSGQSLQSASTAR